MARSYLGAYDEANPQPAPRMRLSQLGECVAEAVRVGLPARVWVVAEVGETRTIRNGHVAVPLHEHEDGQELARMSAWVWANSRGIIDEFESAAGQRFARGIEVLVLVEPRFSPVFGFSLTIHAIDATFTLGALARERRRALERLEAEGLLSLNKQVPMPAAPVRLAVISSAQSAGYQDFVHQLDGNARGYGFRHRLFAAGMQGADAASSICAALERVRASRSMFDVAVLLRGGGSELDLVCFDGWEVSSAVARCPLPVITGIGHERDRTLADEVAHTRCKTPTAAAEAIIDRCWAFEDHVLDLGRRVIECARGAMVEGEERLSAAESGLALGARRSLANAATAVQGAAYRYGHLALAALAGAERALSASATGLASLPNRCIASQEVSLAQTEGTVRRLTERTLEREHARLERAGDRVRLLDPASVLARGYSLTYHDGQVVTDAARLAPGARLRTRLHRGEVDSTVDAVDPATE